MGGGGKGNHAHVSPASVDFCGLESLFVFVCAKGGVAADAAFQTVQSHLVSPPIHPVSPSASQEEGHTSGACQPTPPLVQQAAHRPRFGLYAWLGKAVEWQGLRVSKAPIVNHQRTRPGAV